ncbi:MULTISPECIES: SDR family oxidoreductase [Enterocloster]|uniref:2-deoxy-D-gluconate 3-dehydrogenase n=1 Tax=Enterocloster lavalensis TaxID=460384 RepID=A0A1I0HU53_9FIRM|nr:MULTISPECIES: SDR family oxidoreductase [Enterocloster]MDR3759843.1 SDR family oxidoreductase [Enterocloster sp.]PST32201.1 KR domain-containing protein [Enterocloster lavalensis]SET86773.1 2-deoxy-D-gluconate 3-dehydrogenase [Enterocloster lavalensis]
MKQFPLEHKIAVVTGCAGGIGAGIALGLAEAGADIVGVDLQDLEETAAQVRTLGRRFLAFQVDLSDREAVDAAWTQILAEAGGVDILVNNAGMQYRQNAYEYPLDVFDKVIAVNLRAGYQLAQLAAGHYRTEKKRGKIINLASLFSTFGGVNVSGYTCSKHGVVGMTRALSNEFAADGICVNAIAPGYIATELTKAIWSDPEKSRPMDERIPMGRWGKPQDFAGPAVFLASEASDYVSGIVLPVDGGYSAR